MNTREKPHKPLGKKAYGSIPHLPGSRRGPADKGLGTLKDFFEENGMEVPGE
jgi:hypothetical protein